MISVSDINSKAPLHHNAFCLRTMAVYEESSETFFIVFMWVCTYIALLKVKQTIERKL